MRTQLLTHNKTAYQKVMNDFNEQCHAMSLFAQERQGDILHVDDLSEKIARVIKKMMEG